ncbi:M1 family aminopeptidase [Pedobacter sp. MC2016-15]|uniref:ABC transporter permease/M1 family aminopeptidase n=1 Tax=Pedobacter sp. MC2016-15 TaxID=2994473 RepID=UPI0022458882|nr:M1 family aminopeptidase [Pedobacter sp. MC2016-15]MCX2479385.1 M1 family aminopeptidase [Pedobacter sp. MC2016-15]
MIALLKFELGAYLKKPGIYIVFALLIALGFFIGLKLSFSPGTEIYRNAPYTIANMVGLLSLTGIFITTILAAQIHFKEHDAGFGLILYATPVSKRQYLSSRFCALSGLSFICFILLVAGYLTGHLADSDKLAYREFNLWFYLQPTLLLALPNIFLCSVLVSTVAWFSRNKLIVYITGLFIYIAYLVVLTYSGSPLMAGGLPQSAQALELAAKADPFGLSAFYQQTNLWTAGQKNTLLIELTGDILLNRLVYLTAAAALLLTVYFRFKLYVDNNDNTRSKKAVPEQDEGSGAFAYQPLSELKQGLSYQTDAIRSLVRLDTKVVFKSIPFVLIAVGLVFYMCMEFYGSIDQGIRLPEQYASSALMVNRIIYNLPGLLQVVTLFYAHDLYWRSAGSRFELIENSTPVTKSTLLAAKLITLLVVIILLTSIIIFTGIIFQAIYRYTMFDWTVYAALYWTIDLPLGICAGLMLLIQQWVHRKWAGLLITCIVILLLTSSIGKAAGILHPLLRFPGAYIAKYSEMNGWDDYLRSFSWRMLYGASLITTLWMMTTTKKKNFSSHSWSPGLPLTICILTGIYIYRQTPPLETEQDLHNQQTYEQRYRKYNELLQPVVTAVNTNVDLFPESNAYQVSGRYILKNKGNKPIDSLLINIDEDVVMETATYQYGTYKQPVSNKTGLLRLLQPLIPGDSALFLFNFSYHWSGFSGHQSFNAIVDNGSFIRISNYFPRFGYQMEREINSAAERRKRHLGKQTPLVKLQAPRGRNDFIDLQMAVSVPSGQRVIGVGELIHEWKVQGRDHFLYRSDRPIPFRFGLSAARYQKRVVTYKGIAIEVYYHSRHFENVNKLIQNACTTMDYCQSNFGPYPFKSIRFAEVSSFTDGFAGTAYPATIFMTEHLLFHNNLQGDKGQDVINELAAHEVSHQWWGTARLAPDEREGSKILTETLAMYTELMLAKHLEGATAVKEKLTVHKAIYLSERGFAKEAPLLKANSGNTHLYYSKGLLVMAKLEQLTGEKNVNKALRNLLRKHAYPLPPPVASDLLIELYQVSDPRLHTQIEDLFLKIKSFK